MQARISVITLPVEDLGVARQFYSQGWGWTPVFGNDEVVFFQLNGLVLSLWRKDAYEADLGHPVQLRTHGVAIAHNLGSREEVDTLVGQLSSHGARVLRQGQAQPWGGYTAYVADPDGHVWEIAHNPAWDITPDGRTLYRA